MLGSRGWRDDIRWTVWSRRWCWLDRRGEPSRWRGGGRLDHRTATFSLRLVCQDAAAVYPFATIDLCGCRVRWEQCEEGKKEDVNPQHGVFLGARDPGLVRAENRGSSDAASRDYRRDKMESQCRRSAAAEVGYQPGRYPSHFFNKPRSPSSEVGCRSGYSTHNSCDPKYRPSR